MGFPLTSPVLDGFGIIMWVSASLGFSMFPNIKHKNIPLVYTINKIVSHLKINLYYWNPQTIGLIQHSSTLVNIVNFNQH